MGAYHNLGMALELAAPLFGLEDEKLAAAARAASVDDIGHASQPSPERIIGLNPDLILGDAAMCPGLRDGLENCADRAHQRPHPWASFR